MKSTILILGLILSAAACFAQDLPAAPQPQPVLKGDLDHAFWDKTNTAAMVFMTGFTAADVSTTCNYLSQYENFREVMSPLKSCAGVAFYVSAVRVVSFAGMRLMHNTGHHRLERWIPWINGAASAVPLVYMLYQSKDGRKCQRQFGCG